MVDYGWGPPSAAAPETQYSQLRQKTESAASMALVFSLIGIFTWGFSCIVALFLAPRAKRNIAVSPETRKGKGIALAAQIISAVSLLIFVGTAVAIFGT